MTKQKAGGLNVELLIEAANREKKFFKVYQDFTPNPRAQSLTPKFYARHEVMADEAVPEKYMELIKRFVSSTPKDRVTYPETENQVYGWYSDPLVTFYDDNKLHYPRLASEEIKLIAEVKRNLPKEKVDPNLTPFKL